MLSLPVDPGWRAHVEATIERLEERAARGERYAQLCLLGWYHHYRLILETENCYEWTDTSAD